MSDDGKTVYVVTRGYYSDMTVVAVMSDEVRAEQAIEVGLGDDYMEFVLDVVGGNAGFVFDVPVVADGESDRRGEVLRNQIEVLEARPEGMRVVFTDARGTSDSKIYRNRMYGYYEEIERVMKTDHYRVEADSKERAAKIAADAWAMDNAVR